MAPSDTIFALASAPGRAGVAVLRISGPHATKAMPALGVTRKLPPRHATRISLYHPETRSLIDDALALYFPGPASYTGEDVIELHTHGSPAIIKELLSTLSTLPGLRLAEPGEFTRLAFLNGKMDLTEAEGVADLIAAETTSQKKQALEILHGLQKNYFQNLREQIVHIQALTEAYIDFPDEDIPDTVVKTTRDSVNNIINTITSGLALAATNTRIREGFYITIIGAPNTGKSSLLNSLSKREAAIVSPTAGTTRDIIETHLDLGGYHVILADTAGLRESSDAIEQEGISRALERAERADLRIIMFDLTSPIPIDEKTESLIDNDAIIVLNKADLEHKPVPFPFTNTPILLSVKTGQGMDKLVNILTQKIGTLTSDYHPVVTRQRHVGALERARLHLQNYVNGKDLELTAEELRRAATEIGSITGMIQNDEILDVIFRTFCIGK